MSLLPVWSTPANKDNLAFATVIWSALALTVTASGLQFVETESLLQVVAQAAEAAARLRGQG